MLFNILLIFSPFSWCGLTKFVSWMWVKLKSIWLRFPFGGTKTFGFDAIFFQLVKNSFRSGVIHAGLIALIPKTSFPQKMVFFRPISICNTIYKVISKVLVAWIRHLLKYMISPIKFALFLVGKYVIIFSCLGSFAEVQEV